MLKDLSLKGTVKFILFVVLLFSFSAAGFAEERFSSRFECTTELDLARASEILKRTQSEYAKVASLQARFLQESYLDALEVTEQSHGTMFFEKPGRTRWNYDAPQEQVFILDESRVVFYQVEDKQAFIERSDRYFLSEVPVSFLLGVGDLGRDFTLQSACTLPDGIRLDLTPKDKNAGDDSTNDDEDGSKDLKKFELLVDAKTSLPIGARVYDLSSNWTSILLEQIDRSAKLSADLFNLKFPNDVVVEDRG